MSTVGYVELATSKAADDLEKEIGQKYAQSLGKPWPMPPDVVGPGAYPCGLAVATLYQDLPTERQGKVFRQTHYARTLRYEDGSEGGVLAVDETVEAIADLSVEKIDKAELSSRARALVDDAAVAAGTAAEG